MKKLSITAIILLGALGTSSFASDTSSLTKATVKLIKENRALNQEILNVNSNIGDVNSKIEQDRVQIKNIREDHSVLLKDFNSIKGEIGKIQNLSINSTKYQKEIATLNERLNLLEKKSGLSEQNIQKISKDNTEVSNATLVSQQELKQMREDLKRLNNNVDVTKNQANIDNSTVTQILNKIAVIEGENKNLKASIDSQKSYYDAEVKALKTKLERTNPVIMVQEKEVPCKSGNCLKDADSDDIIKNFIK